MAIAASTPSLLALMLVALASGTCAGTGSTEKASGREAEAQEGGPVRRPIGPVPETPAPPEGIDAIVVPAVVREPQARYRPGGRPVPQGLRLGEVPVPLGERRAPTGVDAMEAIGRRAEALRTLDLASRSVAQDAARHGLAQLFEISVSPPLSEGRAAPPHDRARLPTPEGRPQEEVSLGALFSGLAATPGSLRAHALHDESADRFLVVALERGEATAAEPAGERLLLAISDDGVPGGRWFVTAIDLASGSDPEALGDLRWAFAVDEFALYLLVDREDSTAADAPRRRSVWAIEKGEETGGLYRGGETKVLRF